MYMFVQGFVCPGTKTIKKNPNSTQNKSQTHRAKQYEVTSFLCTDCELSTETCSKNVYSLGPRLCNAACRYSSSLVPTDTCTCFSEMEVEMPIRKIMHRTSRSYSHFNRGNSSLVTTKSYRLEQLENVIDHAPRFNRTDNARVYFLTVEGIVTFQNMHLRICKSKHIILLYQLVCRDICPIAVHLKRILNTCVHRFKGSSSTPFTS